MRYLVLMLLLSLLSCGTISVEPESQLETHKLTYRVIIKDYTDTVEAISIEVKNHYPLGENKYDNLFRGKMYLRKDYAFNSFDTIYLDSAGTGNPIYLGCSWELNVSFINNSVPIVLYRTAFKDTITNVEQDTVTFVWPDDTLSGLGEIQ